MTRYLNLYWYFLIQRLKVLMEYRLSFILGASSTIVWQASSIAAIWIVMHPTRYLLIAHPLLLGPSVRSPSSRWVAAAAPR